MTLDEFFAGYDESRPLFEAARVAIGSAGESTMKVSKTQVSFTRRRGFAWTWIPERSLGRPAAPLVLSIALLRRDPSPRWKQVVEVRRGLFMHHLEVRDAAEIDAQVADWLREAWEDAE